jgi:hypothetical protein
MVKKKAKAEIPPPPGAEASDDELAAYFEKHSMKDLEDAGYGRELTPEELRAMDELAEDCRARSKARKSGRAQLNLAMSPEQLERFMRYAERKHIPPSTLAKAWILERLDHESQDGNRF